MLRSLHLWKCHRQIPSYSIDKHFIGNRVNKCKGTLGNCSIFLTKCENDPRALERRSYVYASISGYLIRRGFKDEE